LKKKILFICTHNSARSQIAEAVVNNLYGNRFEAFSAGTEKTCVKPLAIDVLKEINIDISGARSKLTTAFSDIEFDLVVTVCDIAREACPFFPGSKEMIHKSFRDPSDVKGSDEEERNAFRRSRDEIVSWLNVFLSER